MASNNNNSIRSIAPFTGIMTPDVDDRYLKEGDYLLLENGIIAQDDEGGRFSAKNVRASQLQCTLPFSGIPLGAKLYKNYLYAFYLGSITGLTYLVEIDVTAQDSYTVLFSELIYSWDGDVKSIDIIESQSSDAKFCYWVDGDKQPFKVNITYLKNGGSYAQVSDMYNIRPVPPEPIITPWRDASFNNVNSRDKNFQFAQRWVYSDGEKSPVSSYSRSSFYPDPQIDSAANSFGVSYYVDAGSFYRVSGFDIANAVVISTGYDSAYDNVWTSYDGGVIIMGSRSAGMNVMVSRDYGTTFSESDIAAQIDSLCMSSDGRYVYISVDDPSGAKDLWVSSDYGQIYTKTVSEDFPLRSAIKCSADGFYVGWGWMSGAAPNKEIAGRIYSDYGATLLTTKTQALEDTDTGFETPVAISPGGEKMVIVLWNSYHVSTDSGATWTELTGKPTTKTLVYFDNGSAYGDNVSTTDNFATTGTFPEMDETVNLGTGFIGRETTGDIYTAYDMLGAVIDTVSTAENLAFLTSASDRDLLENIANYFNVVDIDVAKPNEYVDEVEVFAIDVNSGSAYLIRTLEADSIPVDGETISFKNNLLYRLLSNTERSALFSNVPISAKEQAFVGGRLFYINYIDGYTLPEADFSVQAFPHEIYQYSLGGFIESSSGSIRVIFSGVYQLSKGSMLTVPFIYIDSAGYRRHITYKHMTKEHLYLSSSDLAAEVEPTWLSYFPNGSVTYLATEKELLLNPGTSNDVVQVDTPKYTQNGLTYRKGEPITIGIEYMDEYNRTPGPVFDGNDLVVPEDISNPGIQFQVTINNAPPSWAAKFKFVRTDRSLNYRLIPGFQYAKAEGGKVFLMKYATDLYTPDKGMLLQVHSNDGDLYQFPVEGKITKDADFVAGAPAGEWVIIAEPQVAGFTGSDIVNGSSSYYDAIFYAKSVLAAEENLLYYEIPGVHDIADGYHVGGMQDQTASQPAVYNIREDGNVFYLPAVEAEVGLISDNKFFANGGRPLIVPESAKQVNKIASITWSDVFVKESGYNGLSMFNLATANYKDLDVAFGAITASFVKNTNLLLWHEDQVGYVLINKNAITTAAGERVITQQEGAVIGSDFVNYAGTYGTLHPKSIASYGNAIFFLDQKRNVICRLAQNGIVPISEDNMSSYLRGVISSGADFVGVFNSSTMEYWLYDPSYGDLWAFDVRANGWTRKMSPFSAASMHLYNNVVYTLTASKTYAENQGTGYGSIHEQEAPFRVVTSVKGDAVSNMIYDAVEIEANRPLRTRMYLPPAYGKEFNFTDAIIEPETFENREGEYFAPVPMVGSSVFYSYSGGRTISLGEASGNSGGIINLKTKVDIVMGTKNHTVKYIDDAGVVQTAGTLDLLDRSNKIVWIQGFLADDILTDKLVFLEENSYINGSELKGPSVRIELTDSNVTDKLYLFSVQVHQIKSD